MPNITEAELLTLCNQHTTALAQFPSRQYLGISSIGAECLRQTFFTWRFAKRQVFAARLLRLFNRGNQEEPRFIDLLRGAGFKTIDVDLANNRQFEIVWFEGHVKGHCDGFSFINGEWHLLEMKTANNKNWLKFQRSKDLEVANYQYYAQMQAYMDGFKVSKGLFMVVNKDNDNIYLEFIKPNKETVASIKENCVSLCMASRIPERCSQNGSYYKCGFCWYKDICFNNEIIKPTCRMCQHVELEKEGKWKCKKIKTFLHIEQQHKGCNKFLLLEG